MPEPDKIRSAMQRYVTLLSDGDVDGIMSLYGDHPSVEDPVGSATRAGREALRAFYAAAAPKVRVELTGPIRVAGDEGAMPLLAELDLDARTGFADVIDVMKFDDRGRIISMRAFWNPADIRSSR